MPISTKQGFSMLELILIIIIISILFLASRNFFQVPNKHLIESEQCINTLHGQINQFFYQAITGKDQLINSIFEEPTWYKISINQTGGISTIVLSITTGVNYTETITHKISTGIDTTLSSCNKPDYIVLLSGTDITNGGSQITLSKNLINNNSVTSMNICNQTTCPINKPITITEFVVCKKINNIINRDTCQTTFMQKFDMRTQSLLPNRCLSIAPNSTCNTRSIDLSIFNES